MPPRSLYHLDFSEEYLYPELISSPELTLRRPSVDDIEAIAGLMLDAYLGTIDYHGETIEDALEEVHAYFEGRSGGTALTEVSQLAFRDGQLIAACLCNEWRERGQPLVAFVMTSASEKRAGLAKLLLTESLHLMHSAGHDGVYAVITNGNIASERLFGRLGFMVDAWE